MFESGDDGGEKRCVSERLSGDAFEGRRGAAAPGIVQLEAARLDTRLRSTTLSTASVAHTLFNCNPPAACG